MKRFIVITHPEPQQEEAQRINALFDAGLSLLHIRKSGYNEAQLQMLLQDISPVYRDRIALHQCHHLAAQYGLQRLHFPETERLRTTEETWQPLRGQRYTLSTSIHAITDYEQLPEVFDYALLGPFAPSISKPGYGAALRQYNISSVTKREIDLIAIGGLHTGNIKEPVAAGFDGIALLGSIWEGEQTIENFKQLQALWLTTDPVY